MHGVLLYGSREQYKVKPPFFVLANDFNPIELEGTYPLARSAARPLHLCCVLLDYVVGGR